MTATRADTPTITPRPSGEVVPLSFPQERLFLLDRIMPGSSAYNIPALFRVRGTLEAELLRAACEQVVTRHEILRTRISLLDDGPGQEVVAAPRFELPVLDLRGRPPSDRDEEAEGFFARIAQAPFDLGADVLLRAALAHMDADEDRLLIVLHHAGSDHASRKLLLDELDEIYSALENGTEPALPDLSVQYADFAAWQRRECSGERLEQLISYWTGKLEGAPERLELPTDRPRPPSQSYRGSLREFSLGSELLERVRSLARSERATVFMVLLAAFKALLHRYSGAEDLVVGTPISGRRHPEIAKLLGFFSNTLALRTDLSRDPTFSELLARVKNTTIEAQVHQDLPFEKLVEVVNPLRSESLSPIFQVLFGFDVVASPGPAIGRSALEALPIPGWQWSRFDLSVVLREQSDGSIHGRVEYATDLWDADSIERLIGHYSRLLEAAAADGRTRLSALALLSDAERGRMLGTWNDTGRPYDRRCLHRMFEDQAARSPDAVAVSSEAGRITYGELDRRANQLAHALRERGVGRDALVGVCVERSAELVVALLGVLKSGAAYVPIEPAYPPVRQEFMLADAGAAVLVTEEGMLGVVDPRGAAVLCLDRDRDTIAQQPADALDVEADPEQLAYVIYTSGSTGLPKGVEVTHRSVANLTAYMRERPGLGAQDVVANLTTPAFDLSVPDWYLPLSTGARLTIVPREATADGVALGDWLARTGATFVQATPTTWQMLVDAGWKGSAHLKIVCGGEALASALARELRSRGSELWHMYGPTETTVWSSVLQLVEDRPVVALGGPIANTSFYVLDRTRQPVPIGVPGELLIGGEGLARGYRERPELNAEKFVRDPFAAEPGARLYRTGDLVRWRADRTLEFLGRIDQQVKLRGYRIELGEIEAVLAGHPEVGACAATVREDVPGDARLVAYVVPAQADRRPHADDLRALLRTRLPAYMVPSAFVALESMPVTANGKLDRGGLPVPGGYTRSLRRDYAAPESPIQEALAGAWQEILAVDRVGIDDDFFELGGHSMLAVRMLARVQALLGIELPLGVVFQHSTIRELADAITVALLADADDAEVQALLASHEGDR